jgi:glycosyltransferase involved in cell wall biosynthesis
MKVLLVGNYAMDKQASMQRFAEMLQRGLTARGHEVRVLEPAAMLFSCVERKDGVWKWVGYVNKFVLFPSVLRRAARNADIVHLCDHSNGMYVPHLRARPHVVTCHDVIAIRAARGLEQGWTVGFTGRVFQWLILRGLRQARHIACVSQFTLERLAEVAPELGSRSELVPNGLNFPYRPEARDVIVNVLRRLGLAGKRYFLHVGSGHPRKNRAHVARIYARLLEMKPSLAEDLVFVGEPLVEDVSAVVGDLDVRHRVHSFVDVDNETLNTLYSGATAMIFPSLAEGFGWPVIEAQACGCPVFVSNVRPMTDIGGDAAVPISVCDVDQAATVVRDALDRLPALREASIGNAISYSADAMIEAYERLYRRVVRDEAVGPRGRRGAALS